MAQAKILNKKEMTKLLKIVAITRHADRNRLIILLSFMGGMRALEIAALRISDVLGRDGQVKDTIYLKRWQTKGKKSQSIIISDRLQKEIRRYLKKHPQLVEDREGRLFRSQKGGGFSSQTIQNLYRQLYYSSGIDNASSHSGRRSFITNLSDMGISTRVIQGLARHSSLATTQRYIDVSDEKLRNAVNLL